MRLRFRLLAVAVLMLCYVAFGTEKSRKIPEPDREIAITSVEHRDNVPASKSYVVEGHTSGSKTVLYYKLECGTGASDLEVGRSYKAAEMTIEKKKVLLMWNVSPDPDTMQGCDVESVKTH